ncbi:hypothetical protein EV175_004957 [Coemansia sp. RSA 1933]|nr:hypothetical protein EV175_004957 [Coemansia sp. RSA 1933]
MRTLWLLRQLLPIALLTALLVAGAPMPQAGPGGAISSTPAAPTNTATSTSLSEASSASPSSSSDTGDDGGSGSGGVSSTQIYYILALSACAAGFIGFVITLVLRRRRRRQLMLAGESSYGSNQGGLFSHVGPPRNPHQRAPHSEKIVLSEEQFNMLPHSLVEKGSLQATRKRSISASSMLSSKQEGGGNNGSLDEERGRDGNNNEDAEESEVCTICLCDYIVGERMVSLVPCNHMFHSECAFRWLTQKSTSCPLCKADMLEGLGLKHPKSVSNEAASIDVRVEESESDAASASERNQHTESTQADAQMLTPPPLVHVRQDDSAESADHPQPHQ